MTSLSQDPKDRKHFSDLSSILKQEYAAILYFSRSEAKFEAYLRKVAKSLCNEDNESSLNSGRVLDSNGSVLHSRLVTQGDSSLVYSGSK